MRKIFCFTLVLLTFVSCQGQKSNLALNLKKGETYIQNVLSRITIDQKINGQEMKMVMLVAGKVAFKVVDVVGAEYKMDAKYENLSLEMQMPGGSMLFSSEKEDETDIFSTILAEMKKKSFSLILLKNGKVKQLSGIENLFSSMFEKFPELPEAQKQQLKEQLEKAYGEKAFKGNIEMVTAIFPDHAVKKGDKWVIKTELESGMAMNMETNYVFQGNKDAHYLIRGESLLKTVDKDAYVQTNGMPLKYDMEGKMVSDIKIDKESGWIVEAKLKQELKGDAHIKDNPQIPGGLTIPMVMVNEMEISDK